MSRKEIIKTLRTMLENSASGGGFSEHPGTSFRVDATAWAILALKADGNYSNLVKSARSRLAFNQLFDGRVCFVKDQSQTYWPTALAIMAWTGDEVHAVNLKKAADFLISTSGTIVQKGLDSSFTHDPSIQGWAWIENTACWVEPTAMNVLALCAAGYSSHDRVREGVRMLIDRQLPAGGWNLGTTIVYGQETFPQIENTGLALSALVGHVEKKKIERSLVYMKSQVISCRTPLSLGWALFGLGSWGERPTDARRWILDCLSQQKKYGPYRTSLLSLLLLVYEANGGFLATIS